MKRFLVSLGVFVLLASFTASTSASAAVSVFDDMSPKHRAYEAAWTLAAKGVFDPYEAGDGLVRPQKYVTRMEASVMVARLLGLERETNHPGFRDVTVLNRNYNEVAALAERKIIQGFTDRTMRPNDILTRAQMAKLIVDAFDYEKRTSFTLPFTDVRKDNWAAPYVEALVRNNVTAGTTATTYSPDKKLTRAELMLLLHRAYQSRPLSRYNDQEVLNLVNEVQQKPYMILETYKYSQSIRPPFSTFKQEITPFAEGDMLKAIQEFYEISCKECDWILFNDVDDYGLPYSIDEKTAERVTVTVRYPPGMDDAAAETHTIVNVNGQWKLRELSRYQSSYEVPFNLTVQEAKSYAIAAFDGPYADNGLRQYVEEIEFIGYDADGEYSFWIETNTDSGDYYSINPADGMIESEWY